MVKYQTTTSCISLTLTMTADGAVRLTDHDIPFYEVNLHCYTNALYYGNGGVMEAYMNVGDVVSFQNGNLFPICRIWPLSSLPKCQLIQQSPFSASEKTPHPFS